MIELEPLASVRPAVLGRKYIVASGHYQDAIEAPRIATYSFPASSHPHAYHPGLLRAEARISAEVRAELSRMGHRIEVWPAWMPRAGALCAAVLDHAERTLAGGADPRRVAYAVGW